MATEFMQWANRWVRLNTEPLPHPFFTDDSNVYGHVASAVLTTAVTAGSSATPATEIDCPLKVNAIYTFEYNLIYSISGLAVGAQFGIDIITGGVESIGYSVMMAADGSSLRSVATTTEGALIGSGSSFGGGGPWSCCITGALKTSAAADPVARLLLKGSGIGVGVTLQPNSTAWLMES
jgi:hypothetical protein